MTAKQFYDWQTVGGTDDVMRVVDCLERADIPWGSIGGIAVNQWAAVMRDRSNGGPTPFPVGAPFLLSRLNYPGSSRLRVINKLTIGSS